MNEELEIAAAEYVLGTLSGPERDDFVRRLASDSELQDVVARWEHRLSPLAEATPEVAPPADLWSKIERAIATPTAGIASSVVALRRRVTVWRTTSAALGALAAALAIVVVLDRLSVPSVPEQGRYVAVVDSGGREPALIAEVDTNSGTIVVRSVHAEVPSGHSLELWHIPEGENAKSLGILEAGTGAQTIRDAIAKGPVNGIIAVTVEPEGGSPTGVATGPVVYTGRLIPIE
jgi:anti-sigma-K factor RskA